MQTQGFVQQGAGLEVAAAQTSAHGEKGHQEEETPGGKKDGKKNNHENWWKNSTLVEN